MKLSIGLQWDEKKPSLPMARVQLAEALGFDAVFCAEAYGSDAITPLAFIAAHTKRIRLGTSIAQVAARQAAACAMQFNTLDALAGGDRVIIGLGMSGPQIVEGWYGQPWRRPSRWLRDYVCITRKALAREEAVKHDGEVLKLPTDAGIGYGKPLKMIAQTNPRLPIWLGVGAPRMVELCGEIADGWLPFGFVPGSMPRYLPQLEAGFARVGKSRRDFHIQCGAQLIVREDVRSALAELKAFTAFYVGGMGHKDMNFHKEMMIRRGYPEAAERVQECFLAGRRDEAAQAVPDEYVDDGALVGTPERVAERFARWLDAGVDGLTIYGADDDGLRLIADIHARLSAR